MRLGHPARLLPQVLDSALDAQVCKLFSTTGLTGHDRYFVCMPIEKLKIIWSFNFWLNSLETNLDLVLEAGSNLLIFVVFYTLKLYVYPWL